MGGGRVAGEKATESRVGTVRGMPSEATREALLDLAADVLTDRLLDDRFPPVAGTSESEPSESEPAESEPAESEQAAEHAASLLGEIVDVFVGARRLAAWSLWLQLAAAAHLVGRWQSSPPIVDGALPDLVEDAGGSGRGDSPAGALARRLWRVVDELEIWGRVDTGDLAEEFVAAEISAAAGLSHYGSKNVVDAARTLFMTDRLTRTRQLLRAGLLDWTKLRTILTATQSLDDLVCQLVEAAVIPDADLAVTDPLDTLADPAHPGRDLPGVARLTNPQLQAALTEAITAVDAEAASRRAAKARRDRYVSGRPLPDAMGRIEITTRQEEVVAVLAGLDHAVAAAKHAGDPRTADQIRTDHAIHLLTEGAHGLDAYPGDPDIEYDDPEDVDNDDPPEAEQPEARRDSATRAADSRSRAGGSGRRRKRRGRYGRRGLQVRLTVPLATWLGLAEDPAVLDGYGPLPAALARQIAAEAARDHPTTTTWRCVVVHDRHATVLGVGDILPTPRYSPTARQRTFVRTANTFCVFPGCRAQSWRCDIDHRRPYDHDNPTAGGPTCTCNLQPLCRRHHRLKTAGLTTPHLAQSSEASPRGLTRGARRPRRDPRRAPARLPGVAHLDRAPLRLPATPRHARTGRPRGRRRLRHPKPPSRPRSRERSGARHRGPRPGPLGPRPPQAAGTRSLREARRSRRGYRNLATWQDDDPDAPPPF